MKDLSQQFARIDNYTRHLLPSTSTIAEVVKCLCESKGGKGTKGDPGANGDPGLGLNPDLPKIIDIGWVHGTDNLTLDGSKKVTWDDFVHSEGGYNTRTLTPTLPDQIQKHIDAHDPPLIMIYFNQSKFPALSPLRTRGRRRNARGPSSPTRACSRLSSTTKHF